MAIEGFSCRDTYNPFSCSKYVWYCCNGKDTKHFESFIEMMDFLCSNAGIGWWAL